MLQGVARDATSVARQLAQVLRQFLRDLRLGGEGLLPVVDALQPVVAQVVLLAHREHALRMALECRDAAPNRVVRIGLGRRRRLAGLDERRLQLDERIARREPNRLADRLAGLRGGALRLVHHRERLEEMRRAIAHGVRAGEKPQRIGLALEVMQVDAGVGDRLAVPVRRGHLEPEPRGEAHFAREQRGGRALRRGLRGLVRDALLELGADLFGALPRAAAGLLRLRRAGAEQCQQRDRNRFHGVPSPALSLAPRG